MRTSEVTDKFCVYTFCPHFDHDYGCHAPLGEGCDETFTSRRWHEETMTDRVDEFCEKRLKNKIMKNKPNIIDCNYVPVHITPKISKYLDKQQYAGKTFASVKRENKYPYYRLKRGEVLEIANDSCLLEIETVNSVSDDGFSTLMGVVYPYGYEKIWFKMDELEKFETYDENGNIQ